MATDKRQRQRERRQVAQQRAKVTETRGRIRSGGVRVALIVLAIVVAVVVLWLMFRDGGDDNETGDGDVAAVVDQTADGEGADAAPGPAAFPNFPRLLHPVAS